MEQRKPLGIYVHIPFCRKKCEYCDFYSLGGAKNRRTTEDYIYALQEHMQETALQTDAYEVDTVYFGGGTPTFLGADGLGRILGEIYRRFAVAKDAEITFEANPDSADYRTLRHLRKAGFNRISLGVQSDKDELLRALGRVHNFAQAKQAVQAARDAGFSNLSIDLMYGLPNQTREGWADTLGTILAMEPEHLSCYGLTVQPGTPLAQYADLANLPDDETQADMYLYMVSKLQDMGYHQYEISNFCREGFACRHNLKYWTGGEYLGFGPSAASDFSGSRYTYRPDLDQYIQGILGQGGDILSENESISPRERGGEYLMLRMRTDLGISQKEYQTYRLAFEPLENALKGWAASGLAEQTESGRWHFTPQGFLLSNELIARLLALQEQSNPISHLGNGT